MAHLIDNKPLREAEKIKEPAHVEEVEEIEEAQPPKPVEEVEEITSKNEDIPNISKDFENKLKANAQKEKDAPKIKESAENENNDINLQEDSTSSFNWFVFIGGFFVLIVGFVAFLLFKDDNKSIVENEAPKPENKAPFKDFI